MQHSLNHGQSMEADIMEVWAKRAQQQRAALSVSPVLHPAMSATYHASSQRGVFFGYVHSQLDSGASVVSS